MVVVKCIQHLCDLSISSPFLDIGDKYLAFRVNFFIELKMTQANGAIIFNSRLTKSFPLPTREGLGERVNLLPPTPPDKRGANPIRRFILTKVLIHWIKFIKT